jgi:hypothetical protein
MTGVLFTAESPFSSSPEIKESKETAETRAFWPSGKIHFGGDWWRGRYWPEICATGWG